ncbi:MAG: thioredoxin [Aggregatilineales bacterium]
MPIFDTPINTDDNAIERILGQGLPVLLYLFDKQNPNLEEAFKRVAKENAGNMLVVKVDASANPNVHARFNRPALPALLTLDEGEVESSASHILPEDVDAHADFLMGMGPLPQTTTAETNARAQKGALPVHISDASFQQDVLNSDVPVLVDFWAPWCGPCHMVAPVLDRLAEQYAGKIKITKLNVDNNPSMARHYQAMSIPMMLMFKNGQQVGKLVGAHPQGNIEQMIRQAL